MKAKEYLLQLRKMDVMIDCKLEKRHHLMELATRITPTIKEDVVIGGGNHDRMTDAVDKLVDLEREINADIDRYVDLQREAEKLLDKLASTDRHKYDVLYKRYVLDEKWENIAEEMGYSSVSSVYKMHGWALKSFENLMNGKE
ncbi:MAG: hypothetical protein ACI4WX_13875 [Aristaeellaceae bacterium]